MRYGFVLPGGSAPEQLELAVLAEQSGWDGVFVPEVASYAVDAWTLLAAMAQRTSTVRLGTMLTPLPWRRPARLASQVATLDQLSGGRAVLAVGLGAPDVLGDNSDEERGRKVRSERLDEGLDILFQHWRGDLAYTGKHYRVDGRPDFANSALPVQRPHPPVWVVGVWPYEKSMQRVLRCDGLIPAYKDAVNPDERMQTTPAQVGEMLDWLRERGGAGEGFDVVMDGETPTGDPAAARTIVGPWQEAGCTWWLETRWGAPGDVRERLDAGPPRV
jgi:hypothetical protein